MAEALAVKLTLAVVCVMALVARAVGALQGAGAAWVVKLTVAGAEVAPTAQLLTMFTV